MINFPLRSKLKKVPSSTFPKCQCLKFEIQNVNFFFFKAAKLTDLSNWISQEDAKTNTPVCHWREWSVFHKNKSNIRWNSFYSLLIRTKNGRNTGKKYKNYKIIWIRVVSMEFQFIFIGLYNHSVGCWCQYERLRQIERENILSGGKKLHRIGHHTKGNIPWTDWMWNVLLIFWFADFHQTERWNFTLSDRNKGQRQRIGLWKYQSRTRDEANELGHSEVCSTEHWSAKQKCNRWLDGRYHCCYGSLSQLGVSVEQTF